MMRLTETEAITRLKSGVFLIGSASHKVKEGKMLYAYVEFNECIRTFRLSGDFFILPESALEEIEKSIIGVDAKSNVEKIRQKIDEAVERTNAQLIGFSTEDVAKIVKEAQINGK